MRQLSRIGVICLIAVVGVTGCARLDDVQYLVDTGTERNEDGVGYYLDRATKIDYPAVYSDQTEEVSLSHEPRTVLNLTETEIREMSLEECTRTALMNSSVIRSKGAFLSPGNSILASPDRASSIYDPSIQETGVLFGGRGVEAALASFDANFSTTMVWGRNESVQNNAARNNVPGGSTFVGETGTFESSLSKNFGYGGSFELQHNVNYLGTNSPSFFQSAYSGDLSARYRHPLLAGAGVEFTRTAGPISNAFGGLTGVNQGVVIARINHDISLTEFESNLTNLVKDVEDAYWELYLQYRIYDTNVVARNSALRTWRDAKRKLEIGGVRGFSVEDEAQARDRYFDTRAQTQQTLSTLLKSESALRRLIGLPVSDGAVIRPADEPITARIEPDWANSIAEALTNRVELRLQKWNIKSLELQKNAAANLVRPRLDFVASYSLNGFGDDLLDDDEDNRNFDNFYGSITDGQQTGWTTGFVFEMPIGLRSAKAQLRNLELRLAKGRDVLAAQELEIAHEVGNAFQELAEKYVTAQTYLNRRQAARDRADLFEKKFNVGTQTLDLLLRAQASLAEAEVAYFRSLVAYNQAVANLHYRKGTLLPFNSVYMAEGEWDPEAYVEAYRRAKARTYAFDASSFQRTEPPEFVENASSWSGTSSSFHAERLPTDAPLTTEPLLLPPDQSDPAADDELPIESTPALPGSDGTLKLAPVPGERPTNPEASARAKQAPGVQRSSLSPESFDGLEFLPPKILKKKAASQPVTQTSLLPSKTTLKRVAAPETASGFSGRNAQPPFSQRKAPPRRIPELFDAVAVPLPKPAGATAKPKSVLRLALPAPAT